MSSIQNFIEEIGKQKVNDLLIGFSEHLFIVKAFKKQPSEIIEILENEYDTFFNVYQQEFYDKCYDIEYVKKGKIFVKQ